MRKKLNRREFAKASMAAAGAVALPTSLWAKATPATAATSAAALTPAAAAGMAAASTAATSPRKRVTMPVEGEYGGRMSWGRDLKLEETLTPAGAPTPNYPNGWEEGPTIPGEYYDHEKQYQKRER